jgi:hypothetical protein
VIAPANGGHATRAIHAWIKARESPACEAPDRFTDHRNFYKVQKR